MGVGIVMKKFIFPCIFLFLILVIIHLSLSSLKNRIQKLEAQRKMLVDPTIAILLDDTIKLQDEVKILSFRVSVLENSIFNFRKRLESWEIDMFKASNLITTPLTNEPFRVLVLTNRPMSIKEIENFYSNQYLKIYGNLPQTQPLSDNGGTGIAIGITTTNTDYVKSVEEVFKSFHPKTPETISTNGHATNRTSVFMEIIK